MDSFELNKIMGAVLGTCLIVLTLNIAAGALFHPQLPATPGYNIEVPEEAVTGPGPAAPEVPIEELMAKADAQRGEAAIRVCSTCHTFEKGGANRVGPNLYGVVGGTKAHLDNFNYSAAMRGADGNWGFAELDAFLRNPRSYLPGTSMGFAGVSRDTTRADLIAYMNAQSDKPLPLPTAAEAPAEGKPAEGQPAEGKPAEAQPPAAEAPAQEEKPVAQ